MARAQGLAPVAGNLTDYSTSESYAEAIAGTDTAVATGDYRGKEAFAVLVADPNAVAVSAALTGNSNVSTGFGDQADAVLVGSLGAAYATQFFGDPDLGSGVSLTSTALLDLTIDLSSPFDEVDVVLGLLDPVSVGSGFDLLRYQVIGEGNLLVDQSFVDLAAAMAFFDDQFLDLGVVSVGSDGLLDLSIRLDLTGSRPGDGFYVNSIAGIQVVPLPGTFWLLATGIGIAVGRRGGRGKCAAWAAPTFEPEGREFEPLRARHRIKGLGHSRGQVLPKSSGRGV
jgi:hypothetical protein